MVANQRILRTSSTLAMTTPLNVDTSSSSRTQVYSAHLRNALLPELEATRQQLAQVELDLLEYEILRGKLVELLKQDGKGLETLTELGAGVWVEARVPDTKTITIDIGLGLHLDMMIPDAQAYTKEKVDQLKRKRDRLTEKEEHLVWQVVQFQGAMSVQT
ncbi:prefoldin, alpha subunit [Kwoniella newhampshirensis]|uniref:Prefoldin, alpha subunit n=1 Tax=Kwoniella newhampshirensis TaxID=1651941 RepID=A0AAW0YYC4_9TREE